MSFVEFAEQHGLIINQIVYDKWMRTPTTDKPNKKNGAYIWNGQSGAVQNWALHEKPIPFRDQTVTRNPLSVEKQKKAKLEQAKKWLHATTKAKNILDKCEKETHPYLARKGFENEKGYVWNGLLVIPMRIDGSLVGCQLISQDGTKKFLSGQKTKGASAIFDNKGIDIYCEGYATALSIRRALKFANQRYKIHVAFSAGNLLSIAKHGSLVVADNDKIGIETAKKIGTYWVSDKDGEDFNDFEMRVGTEIASQSLLPFIL